MNTKKIISLISSVTILVSGLAGNNIISYAKENQTAVTTAVITENISDETTSTTAQNNEIIDVFSVYDAHKKYIEASKPNPDERVVRNGIDVSTFQHSIDWNQVKNSNVDFAIIRAGYGRELYQVDARFHENVQKAQEAGLDCGAYWYSYATTPEQAVQEAETCYQIIKDYKFEYPIVFDIEDESQKHLSTATISAIIESFCSTLEEKGYYVSLYSYASFLNSSVYQSTLDKYDVWVAHYNVSAPSYTRNYGMWQYSSSGTVAGIDGSVDLDYSYKNYPYLMQKYHLNGF